MVNERIERYGVSTLGYLRSVGIAGYRGPSALIKELVQNADDAPATRLEFEIHHDRLIVRNDGTFSDTDFTAIKEIAAGSKRDDADVTGTWGTGFTSVFQMTDLPEILSGTRHLILDPLEGRSRERDCPPVTGTEFRFPWRLKESDLSRAIEVEPWKHERIDEFLKTLRAESLRNLLFLRNLQEIAVFDARSGAPRQTLRIRRPPLDPPSRQSSHQPIQINVSLGKTDNWTVRWHVFGREIGDPKTREVDGQIKTVKRAIVQVAFGEVPPGMDGRGLLFNFLPTSIETGFRFQINGDFYPSSDRAHIMSGLDDKGAWNIRLINGLADLIAENLEKVRDGAGSYQEFYRLLPVTRSASAPYLQPIVDRVQKRARDGHFVWNLKASWCKTGLALRPADERIERLVEGAGDQLPQVAAPGLTDDVQAYLGVKSFTLVHLAQALKDILRPNTRLENAACPIVQTRERLDQLLREFNRGIGDETSRPGNPRSQLEDAVRGLPLALDHHGILRRLGNDQHCPALASKEVRDLLPESSAVLLDPSFEKTHTPFLRRFLRECSARDVVAALRKVGDQWVGRPLEEADPAIGSWSQLERLWRLIARARLEQNVAESDLAGAPILVDEAGLLRRAGQDDQQLLIADADVAALLAPLQPRFLHPRLATNEEFAAALRLAGVERIGPGDLVARLREWCTSPAAIEDAHPALNDRDKLNRWYAYLHKHADDLAPADRAVLRRLPIVITRDGSLAAAGDDGARLSLPLEGTNALDPAILDALPSMDYLVDTDGLDESALRFLRETLGIQPLSRSRFVREHVLHSYEQAPPEHRLRLLTLIRDEVRSQPHDHDFIRRLREIALIRCTDDVFRRPHRVYGPGAALHDVFPDGWARPHLDDYAAHGDPAGPTAWESFFKFLGLPELPLPDDVVAAAQNIAKSDPGDRRRRDQAMEIYALLNHLWEHYQRAHDALLPLRDLAWLPAQNRHGWHRPQDLVPATFADLAGSQVAAIEARGRVASEAFSRFLAMPTTVPPAKVIAHLRHLGQSGAAQDPTNIYNWLNQAYILREASAELASLRYEPVVYHALQKRWFPPDRTYLVDVTEQLGERRISLPDQDTYRQLFLSMGVRADVDPIPDAIALLQEISAEVLTAGASLPLSSSDTVSVLRAHRLLCRAMHATPDSKFTSAVKPLRDCASVLDTAGCLRSPQQLFIHDEPDVARMFPGIGIPKAHLAESLGVDHDRLLAKLGVQRLSQVIRREVRVARNPQRAGEFIIRLHHLDPHLRRIAAARPNPVSVAWGALNVQKVSPLRIRYELQTEQGVIHGVEEDVPAFYDVAGQRILLSHDRHWDSNLWPLANELSRIIAGDRIHDVSTTVQRLLEFARDDRYDEIKTYLDNAKVPDPARSATE